MTEHPGWSVTTAGYQRVFCLPTGAQSLVRVEAGQVIVSKLGPEAVEPRVDTFEAKHAKTGVLELGRALATLGAVARFRTPDLWDAIGTAILRQVIRAAQSKKMYRAFCEAHGRRVKVGEGFYSMFPRAEVVLSLCDEDFVSLGMAFKRAPLRAAASAYRANARQWRRLSLADLVDALQEVPRIGPWTARAAVADWSNDWSLYPYADLAVRTWARRAAPSFDWPREERAFGQTWRTVAGNSLSAVTLLTLAWGSRHGDIG